ncbi:MULTISPECIES: RNA-binding protein [Methylomonas]|uniref:hypothetical protein n=1 Tax=Methylomonas TaxID=416 RepID=UPI001232C611|nr:hypothetical protein [Methylomonas rhizoryzae]
MDSHPRELVDFIEPALKGGLFKKAGRIIGARVLVLHDPKTGNLECHGLINVLPDSAAARAIKKLRGNRFKGKFTVIRPYYYRSWHNDVRQNRPTFKNVFGQDRRVADRRRGTTVEIVREFPPRLGEADSPIRW